jgi:HKD family nuclease
VRCSSALLNSRIVCRGFHNGEAALVCERKVVFADCTLVWERLFMADLVLILQAATVNNHADAVKQLLAIGKPTAVIVSVAFARESGISVLESTISPIAKSAKFFVGIRNDITSVQAIKRLVKIGVELYAVDTGSRTTIFHPKLYLAANAIQARAIIGSANMTFNGLYNNIEVSTSMRLDMTNSNDKEFVTKTIQMFSDLKVNHPRHVFQITDEKHADKLFEEGRLVDESIVWAPSTTSTLKKGERDDLTPMLLKKHFPPKVGVSGSKSKGSKKAKPETKLGTTAAGKGTRANYYQVWESKALSERDLNIPRNLKKGTNPTGSMGWKKGAYDDIDQRHYFRDEVFDGLAWKKDKPPSKIERATANFELVIKNINYGVFELLLSHNFDTTSASYKQSNMMTQLHWGEAKQLIAKKDLLGRTLLLYRKDSVPPEYLIEID